MIEANLKDWAIQLAGSNPTPFYAFDLDAVERTYQTQVAAWSQYFPHFRSAYSYKTNSLKAIGRLLQRCGASAEVVTAAELEMALEDGFSPDSIIFDGPVKTKDEILKAVSLGIRVQVDSLDEIDTVIQICSKQKIDPILSPRLSVAHNGKTSRFGMTGAEYYEAERRLSSIGVTFQGVHIHIGSNICEPKRFSDALAHNMSLIRRILEKADGRAWLDIGGGFPAHSVEANPKLPEHSTFAGNIARELIQGGVSIDLIELIIEPGRSLVEDFAVVATRVVTRKYRDEDRILVVDAGSNLIRSIRNWHHPVEFTNMSAEVPYDVYGALCFESDRLAHRLMGPRNVSVGDLIIVGEAGGYDLPSANIWTRPSPAIFGRFENEFISLRRRQYETEMRMYDVDLEY